MSCGPGKRGELHTDAPEKLGLFNEDIRTLTARVARLNTGMAWAEDPPSRTHHLIINIETAPGASATEQDFYVGVCEDRLRRVDDTWKIAGWRMALDQNVLTAKNLSIYF